jgi:hypothetical protein
LYSRRSKLDRKDAPPSTRRTAARRVAELVISRSLSSIALSSEETEMEQDQDQSYGPLVTGIAIGISILVLLILISVLQH